MKHADHIALIKEGIPGPGGIWADLGSGQGAFTLALAELIGPTGRIYSVDKDRSALGEQERQMRLHFPEVGVQYIPADFTKPLDLPTLDGIVMANALHFHRNTENIVKQISSSLRPGGRFVLVEYNAASGNPWVPHPIPEDEWRQLADRVGFSETRLLSRYPSRFLREIYSALSIKGSEA